MVFNLRKPSVKGRTAEEQIKEIEVYLGYVAKELTRHINDINAKINDVNIKINDKED